MRPDLIYFLVAFAVWDQVKINIDVFSFFVFFLIIFLES